MKRNWLIRIIFVMGFLLCIYPLVASLCGEYEQTKVVHTYQNKISQVDANAESLLKDAINYNKNLYQANTGQSYDTLILSKNSYNKNLNILGNGIMGSLDIPKIGVSLPIYHGTSQDVLVNGIGHIEGTSLPIGGENTHAVLSGHRGLPSAKLLVRLDELRKEDYIYLHIGDETLAYQVKDIQVVEPDNTDCTQIQDGRDLLSVVTCTPYGVNTHRLVVTGERIDYNPETYQAIKQRIPSTRELMLYMIPIIIVLIIITYHTNKKWRRNFLYENGT